MSDWDDLEPVVKPGATKEPVRFRLVKVRGAPARGQFLIRRDVLAPLSMPTWRCSVRLGKGARAHQVAILHDPEGRFELLELGKAKGGGTYRLLLPPIDRFPDLKTGDTPMRFRVEHEGKRKMLVIDLPPYCWDANIRRKMEERMAHEARAAA